MVELWPVMCLFTTTLVHHFHFNFTLNTPTVYPLPLIISFDFYSWLKNRYVIEKSPKWLVSHLIVSWFVNPCLCRLCLSFTFCTLIICQSWFNQTVSTVCHYFLISCEEFLAGYETNWKYLKTWRTFKYFLYVASWLQRKPHPVRLELDVNR